MRPYESEDEFLAREMDTLTRSSIVLLGASTRPQGVVLRFEVVLTNGEPLVRGEGRVTAYREGVFEDLPGLTLRFTRLDSKSKALIDRATSMRDARRSSAPPPPVSQAASQAPPSEPTRQTAAPLAARPPLTLALDLEATRVEAPATKARSERPPPKAATESAKAAQPASRVPLRPAPPSSSIDLEATRAEVPSAKSRSERPPPPAAAPSSSTRASDAGPPSSVREDVLGRMRARAKSLAPDAVQAILERGKPRG